MRRFILIIAASLSFTVSSLAVPLDDIDSGDVYYLNEFGSNSRVVVVSVERSTNRIKIRREDGTTDWTSPDRLLTSQQSTGSEVVEAVGWAALFAAGVCALSETCRNEVTKSDSSKTAKPSP